LKTLTIELILETDLFYLFYFILIILILLFGDRPIKEITGYRPLLEESKMTTSVITRYHDYEYVDPADRDYVNSFYDSLTDVQFTVDVVPTVFASDEELLWEPLYMDANTFTNNVEDFAQDIGQSNFRDGAIHHFATTFVDAPLLIDFCMNVATDSPSSTYLGERRVTWVNFASIGQNFPAGLNPRITSCSHSLYKSVDLLSDFKIEISYESVNSERSLRCGFDWYLLETGFWAMCFTTQIPIPNSDLYFTMETRFTTMETKPPRFDERNEHQTFFYDPCTCSWHQGRLQTIADYNGHEFPGELYWFLDDLGVCKGCKKRETQHVIALIKDFEYRESAYDTRLRQVMKAMNFVTPKSAGADYYTGLKPTWIKDLQAKKDAARTRRCNAPRPRCADVDRIAHKNLKISRNEARKAKELKFVETCGMFNVLSDEKFEDIVHVLRKLTSTVDRFTEEMSPSLANIGMGHTMIGHASMTMTDMIKEWTPKIVACIACGLLVVSLLKLGWTKTAIISALVAAAYLIWPQISKIDIEQLVDKATSRREEYVEPKGLGEISETLCELDIPIIGTVVAGLAALLFLKGMPDDASWMKLYRKFDAIPRAVAGFERLTEYVSKAFNWVKTRYIKRFHPDMAARKMTTSQKVEDFCKSIEAIMAPVYFKAISTDEEKAIRCSRIFAEYMDIIKSGNEIPHAALNSLKELRYSVNQIMQEVYKSNVLGNAYRMRPVTLFLVGDSSVGKTALTYPLGIDMLREFGYLTSEMLEKDPDAFTKFFYSRNTKQEFWDGYNGNHHVVIYDDAFQARDSASTPNEELTEIIHTVNNFPMNLHMADLKDKANTTFVGKGMIFTSNDTSMKFQSITSNEAIYNRLDLSYRVFVKQEYRVVENGTITEKIDLRKARAEGGHVFNMDIYEFQEFKLGNNGHGLVGDRIDFPELRRRVIGECRKRKADFVGANDFLRQYARDSFVDPRGIKDIWSKITEPLFWQVNNPTMPREYGQEDIPFVEGQRGAAFFQITNKSGDAISQPQLVTSNAFEYARFKSLQAIYSIRSTMTTWWNAVKKAYDADPAFMVFGIGIGVLCLLGPMWALLTMWQQKKIEKTGKRIDALNKSIRSTGTKYKNYGWGQDGQVVFRNEDGTVQEFFDNDGTKLFTNRIYRVCGEHLLDEGILMKDKKKVEACGHSKSRKDRGRKKFVKIRGITSEVEDMTLRDVLEDPDRCDKTYIYGGNVYQFHKVKAHTTGDTIIFRIEGTTKPLNQVEKIVLTEVVPCAVQSTNELARKALSNTYWLEYKTNLGFKTMGSVFGLKGHLVLMPQHYHEYCREKKFEDTTIMRLRNETNKTGVEFLYKNMRDTSIQVSSPYGKKDLCVFSAGKNVPSFKNCVGNFVSRKDLHKISGSNVVFNYRPSSDGGFFDIHRQIEGTCWSEDVPRKPEGGGEIFWYRENYIVNTYAAVKGDCGNVLVADNKMLAGKLCGVLVAGASDMTVFAAVAKEDLEAICKKFSSQDQISWTPDDTIKEEFFEACHLHNVENFVPLGTAPAVPAATKTQLQKTEVYEQIYESKKAPAHLRPFTAEDGTRIDPLEKSMEKIGLPSLAVWDELVHVAASDVLGQLKVSHHENIKLQDYQKVLTFEEAVTGIDGDEYMGSITRSSSPGYPFVFEKSPQEPGKSHWMGIDGDFRLESPEMQGLKKRVLTKLVKASRGERSMNIYIDTLKDEKRPKAKVEQGKTRLFSAAPMDLVIMIRQFYLPMMAFLMHNHVFNGIAVGINPHSIMWDRLARRLEGKGQNIVAGDFSNYDGSLNAEILRSCNWIFQELYNDGEQNRLIRDVLFEDVVSSFHICEGKVYQWNKSLPSGVPLTVMINSIYNLVATRIVWMLETDRSMMEFNETISMIAYGDDNVISVGDQVKDEFTQEIMARGFEKIGMIYTDENKNTFSDYRTLQEVTFLKRGFRFDEGLMRYVGPLEPDSITEMLNWYHKTGNPDVGLALNVSVAMREWSKHGEKVFSDEYNRIMSKLSDKVKRHLQVGHSYLEYQRLWRSGKLDILDCIYFL